MSSHNPAVGHNVCCRSTDQSNKEMLRCAGGVSAFTAALMANQDIDDPWLISFLILVLGQCGFKLAV